MRTSRILLLAIAACSFSHAAHASVPEPDHLGLTWSVDASLPTKHIGTTAFGIAYDDGTNLVLRNPDGTTRWTRPSTGARFTTSENFVFQYSYSGSSATVSSYRAIDGAPVLVGVEVADIVSASDQGTWEDHILFSGSNWLIRVDPTTGAASGWIPINTPPQSVGTAMDDIGLTWRFDGQTILSIGTQSQVNNTNSGRPNLLLNRGGVPTRINNRSTIGLDVISGRTTFDVAPSFTEPVIGTRTYGDRVLLWSDSGDISGARTTQDGCAPLPVGRTSWTQSIDIDPKCPVGASLTIVTPPPSGTATIVGDQVRYQPANDSTATAGVGMTVRAEIGSNVQYVTVGVQIDNQPPTCSVALDSTTATHITGHFTCADPEGQAVSLQAAVGATTGTGLSFTVPLSSGGGSWRFRPDSHAVTTKTPTHDVSISRNADVACIDDHDVRSWTLVQDLNVSCVTLAGAGVTFTGAPTDATISVVGTATGVRATWGALQNNQISATVTATPATGAPLTLDTTFRTTQQYPTHCDLEVFVPASSHAATLADCALPDGAAVTGQSNGFPGTWTVDGSGELTVQLAAHLRGGFSGTVSLTTGLVKVKLFVDNAPPMCTGLPTQTSTTVARPNCTDPEGSTVQYFGPGLTSQQDGTLFKSGRTEGFVYAGDESGRRTKVAFGAFVVDPTPPGDPLPPVDPGPKPPVDPGPKPPTLPPASTQDSDGDGFADAGDCAPFDARRPSPMGLDVNCNGLADLFETLVRVGTSRNDRLQGGNGTDTLRGAGGNDVINGNGGNDIIDGGVGSDRLDGGAGDDRVAGGTGRDTLTGAAGNDMLDGGADADSVDGGVGNDTIVALRGGKDTIKCGAGVDKVTADPSDIVARDCERVTRR